MKKSIIIFLILAGLLISRENPAINAENKNPPVFPFPIDIQVLKGNLILDSNTFIVISQKPSGLDRFLAGLMSNEFADKYELSVLRHAYYILWSGKSILLNMLSQITEALVNDINFRFSGKKIASKTGKIEMI